MAQKQPIKYGDVFIVSEAIANKAITLKDASDMELAEKQVLGHTRRGGPADIMHSVALMNLQAGLITSEAANEAGISEGKKVTECVVGRRRIITQSFGDEVVAHYILEDPEPDSKSDKTVASSSQMDRDVVTIEEGLKATTITGGDKPVHHSNAAAIQVPETLAIGGNRTIPHTDVSTDANTELDMDSQP